MAAVETLRGNSSELALIQTQLIQMKIDSIIVLCNFYNAVHKAHGIQFSKCFDYKTDSNICSVNHSKYTKKCENLWNTKKKNDKYFNDNPIKRYV